MIIEAVKYSIGCIKNHFWAIVKIFLVFVIIVMALGFIVPDFPFNFSGFLGLGKLNPAIFLLKENILLFVVLAIVWRISFVSYLLSLERTGSASIEESFKKIWSTRTPYYLVQIIFFLVCLFIFIATIMAIEITFKGVSQLLTAVLIVVALLPFFYLIARFLFVETLIIDKNIGIFTALSTSWSATKGWFWRLFLLLFVVTVGGILAKVIASGLSNLIVSLLGNFVGDFLGKALEVFFSVINLVFASFVVIYYYLQLKVAKTLVDGR